MLIRISECVVIVYNTIRTVLWERATYWRGQTLHSFTNMFFQDFRSGQADVEAHVFYYVIKIFKQNNRLIGFLKAQYFFYEKVCIDTYVFFHDGMLRQRSN